MSKKLKENTFFILTNLVKNFFVSLLESIYIFLKYFGGKNPSALKENTFLDVMNFFFHIGPKAFWKAPSWLKIGRSASTLLHFIFKKEQVFIEKKWK
jgi:hypothetical protein